ncbi:MAG: four helix bundle protein [Maribacter sp.]|jgi:four helix bundle protein
MIKNFKSLEIWKRSIFLVKEIYLSMEQIPSEEKFGLTNQLKRAAVSIPSNIAEGCGRNHIKELIQFLHYSTGSLCEVETQLYLAISLEFIPEKQTEAVIAETIEIRKMIQGYINSIQR